jgi:prephenate dehydrogenase
MKKKLDEMAVTVVGVGQIGGSFVLALKDNQIGKKIIGVDKKEVIEGFPHGEIFDSLTCELESAVHEADFIFLAVPVLTILKLLPTVVSHMKPEAVLLDSGSTKKEIVTLMKRYPEQILIGGHPMTGREKHGFESASPDLLNKKMFALVFPTAKSLEGKEIVFSLLERIGALPMEIEGELHDLIVSLTSHLPYVLSLVLSDLAEDYFGEEALFERFVASGFLGATRLSLTHGEMGKGILKSNSRFILRMIDEYKNRLDRIKELVDSGNEGKMNDFFDRINKFQSGIG